MNFSTNKGTPLAQVVGGKADGEIIYLLETDENKKTTLKTPPCRKVRIRDTSGKYQQIPNPKVRVLYIAAPSGAGKTTYAAHYIAKYLEENPEAEFYIVSCLDEDENLDYLGGKRLIVDESILEEPLELDDCPEGSIILFDDIDGISNLQVQKAINKFKEKLLIMGRHKNLQVVVTSHLIQSCERSVSRMIMNEAQSITFFPCGGAINAINYTMKQYYGLNPRQIAEILDTESRWVTLVKTYPQILITEKECVFLNSIGKGIKKKT